MILCLVAFVFELEAMLLDYAKFNILAKNGKENNKNCRFA